MLLMLVLAVLVQLVILLTDMVLVQVLAQLQEV